jgi:hypothetical protein
MGTIQSNQLWLKILRIIQNPWRFGRSCNNEKCSKLDFLPPRIFPNLLSIFLTWKIDFWVYLKSKNYWCVGPTGQPKCRHAPCSHWLVWKASDHCAGIKRPAFWRSCGLMPCLSKAQVRSSAAPCFFTVGHRAQLSSLLPAGLHAAPKPKRSLTKPSPSHPRSPELSAYPPHRVVASASLLPRRLPPLPMRPPHFLPVIIPIFYAKIEYSSYAWPRINCSTHTAKSAHR